MINFKKISAIVTSTLLVGMTMGVAAAANYPVPFVQNGAANVAIVYGTGQGVSFLDTLSAGDIQTDLQRYLSTGTGGSSTSVSGEAVSLDTSNTRIYLNTSLNVAKSTLTKADLPTVLADYTFSGNVDSKLTSTIKLVTGNPSGADNSGKVIFEKQPTSSDDPALGISMGTSQTSYPLYNASVTMAAINFTAASSKGEEIVLFGQKFTVASDTDTSTLVLLKEAQKVSLDSDNPSATATVGGATYTVELVSASDTAATIKVTDSTGKSDQREISEAASRKISGVQVAVITADETNLKLSASIIVGAQKIKFTAGSAVTTGDSDDPIMGTYAYLVGGTGALTELAVAVFRPDGSTDAILAGDSFTDPVFGSFKLDFAAVSSPLDDASRDIIKVEPSGVRDIQATLTTADASTEKTFTFAHNESSQWRLADSSNYSIGVMEMANLSYGNAKPATGIGRTVSKYIVIGNEDYGHILELYDIYNVTTGSNSITGDRVKFKDVIDGTIYATTFTSTEGSGTLDVDGKRYTVTYNAAAGDGENGWAQVKYPTSDSADANTYVVYPTIKTKNGALVALYEPLKIQLNDPNADGTSALTATLNFPDGDGYTAVALTSQGYTANDANWSLTGGGVTAEALNTSIADQVDFTIGKLKYNITSAGSTNNLTTLYLVDPETTANIDQPALIIFEARDSDTNYNAIVVDLETNPAGTSTDGVGVADVLFSSKTHFEAQMASDTDITKHVDWFGTLVDQDANTLSQTKATISYPKNQVYAELYMGEVAAAITPGTTGTTGTTTSIGAVKVRDTEVASSKAKNLIVIGGSCINSAAATLVGGSYCGEAWTTATGTGAGQFLIKSFATSTLTDEGKIALLVAGYNAEDTVNAATYLQTQPVDTSKTYKGTSSTTAVLETTTA